MKKKNEIKYIMDKIQKSNLKSYQKFNLYSGIIVIILASIVSIPPFLSLINDIFATILNGLAYIITGNVVGNHQNDNSGLNLIVSLLSIFLEMILCKVYCLVSQRFNKPK